MTTEHFDNSILNVEAEELKEFLKGCVLPGDVKKIESKMRETVETRKEMIKSSGSMLPKVFNFYWIDTQLVLLQKIRYSVTCFNQKLLII